MLPYWLIFLSAAGMALTHMRPRPVGRRLAPWNIAWGAFFMLLVLTIGLRHEIGADWFNYMEILEASTGESFKDTLPYSDPAYALINWIGANIWGGIHLVNFVCALIFSWGLLSFCRAQPRPWLALLVAIPYLVIVVAMGYSRQAVALGLTMVGLTRLASGSTAGFLSWVILGATFHKSAVILLPMVLFLNNKHRFLTALWVFLSGALLFVLLIQEAMSSLYEIYLESEYSSSGAAIRVAMNAIPAAIFILLRKRFQLPMPQQTFWKIMSWVALLFIVLLAVSPSSTAVDRLALYWIPLQMFVGSRLPDALGRPGRENALLVCAVVIYSAFILLVWLLFATYAYAWLPYKFYPWEILWS